MNWKPDGGDHRPSAACTCKSFELWSTGICRLLATLPRNYPEPRREEKRYLLDLASAWHQPTGDAASGGWYSRVTRGNVDPDDLSLLGGNEAAHRLLEVFDHLIPDHRRV